MRTSEPHALYRFYGAGGTLLYIGITNSLPRRLTQHNDKKPWWLGVSTVKVEHYPSREAVLEAEKRAIIAERPLYNEKHNKDGLGWALVEDDWMPCDRCSQHARNEITLELLSSYFQEFQYAFSVARAYADQDLAEPEGEREFHWENDEVIVTAHYFLQEIVNRLNGRDYIIRTFLDRMPQELRDDAMRGAMDDIQKAGEPYPLEVDFLPHMLRHVGYILQGVTTDAPQ